MSNDWFRSWHGAPTDPKWLLIAKRANVRPIHVIGTWWALLDYASQHSERGSIDGFDIETFALFAGLEDEHVSRIVTTMRDKGLLDGDRIVAWGKRQPKKEDPEAGARKARSRDKNGGFPPRGGGADAPRHGDVTPCHAASHDVTLDKRREDKISSEAKASGTIVPHPAADFAKVIFDSGLAMLTASGRTERDARSVIGRWRKSNSDAAVLDVFRRAEIEQPSDPLEWIAKALEASHGKQPQAVSRSGHGRTIDAAIAFVEGE